MAEWLWLLGISHQSDLTFDTQVVSLLKNALCTSVNLLTFKLFKRDFQVAFLAESTKPN